jgi:hypothetical protein
LLGLAVSAPARAHRRRILALELVIIGETQVLLQSAFRRVLLYEDAYGFTVARVVAQSYMIVMAVALLLLAWQLVRQPRTRRILGQVGAMGVVALASLGVWNHEGWIVHKNFQRYTETGKLDTRYLACDLSENAVPALLGRARQLPAPEQSRIREALASRFAGDERDVWYEWNAGRARAAPVLDRLEVPAATGVEPPCWRKWE